MTSITEATKSYNALRETAAWRDLSDRGRLRITGEDRARLLHAMSTNHVQGMQPGDGLYTYFLNAQGRIIADATLLCFEDHLLLDTEPELRVMLYEHLDRYIIADDVNLEDVTESLACVSIEGPQAIAALERVGAPVPETPHAWLAWGDRVVARQDTTGMGGFFVYLPGMDKIVLAGTLSAMGIPEATADEARTVRIENGRARYGEEITERYLVQEAGLQDAVHFTKGCYLGQEIVERVRSRGQVHRVLGRVSIDSMDPPEAGTKYTKDGAPAAEIASATYSPALGKVIAMAYVRTQFADAGTMLDDGVQVV